jgi:hypothetical protein
MLWLRKISVRIEMKSQMKMTKRKMLQHRAEQVCEWIRAGQQGNPLREG